MPSIACRSLQEDFHFAVASGLSRFPRAEMVPRRWFRLSGTLACYWSQKHFPLSKDPTQRPKGHSAFGKARHQRLAWWREQRRLEDAKPFELEMPSLGEHAPLGQVASHWGKPGIHSKTSKLRRGIHSAEISSLLAFRPFLFFVLQEGFVKISQECVPYLSRVVGFLELFPQFSTGNSWVSTSSTTCQTTNQLWKEEESNLFPIQRPQSSLSKGFGLHWVAFTLN